MDFDPPEVCLDAVRTMLDSGDLGYRHSLADDMAEAWAAWQHTHFGWQPDTERTRPFTSVLHALEVALWLRTKPGDGIVVFTPIYHPFLHAIRDGQQRLIDVPLEPTSWRLDLDRLEASIDDTTSAILFCQPHNPTGRMFDDDEIHGIAEVAERHDLLVMSDEIWADLTHVRTHRPLASIDERFAGRLVTVGSASKSFNLAGTRCAIAHFDDAEIFEQFASMPSHVHGGPSTLSMAAAHAAWTQGQPWLDAIRSEIADRRQHLASRLASECPQVGFEAPEATYLGWLDFNQTAIADDPTAHLLKRAKVALSPGTQFGTGGDGCGRLNFATSQEILDAVLDRIIELANAPSDGGSS